MRETTPEDWEMSVKGYDINLDNVDASSGTNQKCDILILLKA